MNEIHRSSYSAEPGDGQADASLVLVRVALDEGLDERGGGRDDAQVLVVEQVDDARRPLAAGDHLGTGAQQPQQAQRRALLHHVHRVAAAPQKKRVKSIANQLQYADMCSTVGGTFDGIFSIAIAWKSIIQSIQSVGCIHQKRAGVCYEFSSTN